MVKNIKLARGAKASWLGLKWYSQQINIIIVTMNSLWLAYPVSAKEAISTDVIITTTIILAVVGYIFRLIDQGYITQEDQNAD